MDIPISNEVVGVFSKFADKDLLCHKDLNQIFMIAGCDRFDACPGSKPNRVLTVGRALLESQDERIARSFVDQFLSVLRTLGIFTRPSEKEDVDALRASFRNLGWELTKEGRLTPLGDTDLETGGRQALDEQLRRLQQNLEDPAVLLGVAKDLIEAIGKFVLEERGQLPGGAVDFPKVLGVSLKQLQLRPQDTDTDAPGGKQLREIRQHANAIAGSINELRNLQGTGHGRTLPTGVSAEEARYVIRQATLLAELMLSTHDRQMGRA